MKILSLLLVILISLSGIGIVFAACDVLITGVAVEPAVSSSLACYTINITTSCQIALGEFIRITLPEDAQIYFGLQGSFSFEGRNDRFSGFDNILDIQLTTELPAGRHQLRICNVRNPSSRGPHRVIIKIPTSSFVSPEFFFRETSVSQPEVTVNPDYINVCAEYTIRFKATSESGKGCNCHQKETVFNIIFPPDVTIGIIEFGSITVNGRTVYSDNVQGHKNQLIISVSTPIDAGEWLEIRISTKAGIRNPSKPGWYTLTLWTSVDTVPIKSKPYYIRPSSVTRATVTLDEPYTCTPSGFSIKFKTGPQGSLNTGSRVRLIFPKGFTLPKTVGPDNIMVNDFSIKEVLAVTEDLSLEAFVLNLSMPVPVSAENDVVIIILSGANIKLPSIPAVDYNVMIETSAEPVPVPSLPFAVGQSKIGNVTYDVKPMFVTLPATHTVTFKTGGCGDLTPGLDTITIVFSPQIIMPLGFTCQGITINDVPIKNIPFLQGSTLTISPPMTISGLSWIRIVIPDSCGIRNPSKAGFAHKVQVWTSREQTKSFSGAIMFATTQLSGVTLELDKHIVYKRTQATLSLTLGKAGALLNGAKVFVKFDNAWNFEGRVSPVNFAFNGTASRGANWENNILTLTSSKFYEANSTVTIDIDESAGLRTPQVQGIYHIQVWTDPEPDSIESKEIPIANPPTCEVLTTPRKSDGNNNWFKTKPIVEIKASCFMTETPKIQLEIDYEPVEYKEPFELSDGTHFIKVVAIDAFGNHSQEAKVYLNVDSTPPQFDPEDGDVFTKNKFWSDVLRIHDNNNFEVLWDEQQDCTVQKTSADIYWIDIKIQQECTRQIVVRATDDAGNTGEWRRFVTFDWTAPSIDVPSIIETSSKKVSVVGTIDDPESLLTIDTNIIKIEKKDSLGYFNAEIRVEHEGVNLVKLDARDKAGNTNIKTIKIIANLTKTAKIVVGSKEAEINGMKITLKVAPYLKNGYLMISDEILQSILNGFEFTYSKNNGPNIDEVKIANEKKQAKFKVGVDYALVDGEPVKLKIAPEIRSGLVFFHARFFADYFGAKIVASGKNYTISYTIDD